MAMFLFPGDHDSSFSKIAFNDKRIRQSCAFSRNMTDSLIFSTFQSLKERMSSNSLEDMILAAIHNLKFCYAPYSRFKVSCILESTDGRLFSGVNVENVSYGLTVCAERTAICKAVSEGCLNFQRIVITCHDPNVNITPCGACRQVLYEVRCLLETWD